MCLSFQHKLAGHHVGMLQVFVEKGRQHSPAMWGRMGGSGWSSAQITLWGNKLERVSIILFKTFSEKDLDYIYIELYGWLSSVH